MQALKVVHVPSFFLASSAFISGLVKLCRACCRAFTECAEGCYEERTADSPNLPSLSTSAFDSLGCLLTTLQCAQAALPLGIAGSLSMQRSPRMAAAAAVRVTRTTPGSWRVVACCWRRAAPRRARRRRAPHPLDPVGLARASAQGSVRAGTLVNSPVHVHLRGCCSFSWLAGKHCTAWTPRVLATRGPIDD